MNQLTLLFSNAYGFLFGCSHENVTRPFTLNEHTYKVCLDCGSELPYSLQAMRYLPARRSRKTAQTRTATVLPFEAPRTIGRDNALQDSSAAA